MVGTGIQVGHLTLVAQGCIQQADKVLFLVADPVTQHYLRQLNPTAESLADLYGLDKHRHETYTEMAEKIIGHVRQQKDVCAVFYGHPGVFVTPSHEAIRLARAEGFQATMHPGISAEDCLFADLGIDPVRGCQSFEATDFLIRPRPVDPFSGLIIWQIGVIGDATWKPQYDTSNLRFLVSRLSEFYDPQHDAIVYVASQFAVAPPSILRTTLAELVNVAVTPISTLYVPPKTASKPDLSIASELGLSLQY